MGKHEWRQTYSVIKRKLIDGTEQGGKLMRRWINGEWQYRALTDEERAEESRSRAW